MTQIRKRCDECGKWFLVNEFTAWENGEEFRASWPIKHLSDSNHITDRTTSPGD